MVMDPERGSAQYSSSVQFTPIKKLNGSNYATWSFQMKLVSMDSDLWTTVQPGEELKDVKDHRKVHLHEARQSEAFAKICLAIGDEQQLHLSSPKDVWEELQRLFAPRDSKLRILQLRRQLYAEKLENCAGVDAYFGRMNRIASELVSIGDRIDDGDIAMTILCGLPKKWDVVVSSICNLPESEFSRSTVKRRLLAKWQRRIDSDVRSVEAMTAEAVQRMPVEKRQSARVNIVCFKCGEKGHYARECAPGKKGREGSSRQIAESATDGHSSNMFASCYGASTDATTDWIIDSGATHHMCPHKRYFNTLYTSSSVRTNCKRFDNASR
uniref:CCHC-type domain-containing protein n=1 Tax=Trichuris muris TaxID=70415 RepID=A0A5S6QYN1_TRIMR